MENIYRVNCTEKIKIGEFLSKFQSELCPDSVDALPQTYDEIKNLLGIEDEVNEELLDESISLNNLAQPDDIPVVDFQLSDLHAKAANRNLQIPTGAMQLRCAQKRLDSAMNSKVVSIPGKYNRYRYVAHNFNNADDACDLKPFDDVVITVRVYEPFAYRRGACSNRKPRLSQEFNVLGRQRLTDLRDKIYCHCQFGPFHDISNDFDCIMNDTEPSTTSRTNDIGFFFITDTFYNDTRASETDYSVEIREWMERQADIGPVQVKSMDETKFSDLEIRLGFPQVFRHYLNCEHVVIFSDIRLLASDDSLKSIDYPMLRCVTGTKEQLCIICGIIEATFVVRNSNCHIQNPAFLCRDCLVSYHYVDEKKIGQFQAFRYFGNRPILDKE